MLGHAIHGSLPIDTPSWWGRGPNKGNSLSNPTLAGTRPFYKMNTPNNFKKRTPPKLQKNEGLALQNNSTEAFDCIRGSGYNFLKGRVPAMGRERIFSLWRESAAAWMRYRSAASLEGVSRQRGNILSLPIAGLRGSLFKPDLWAELRRQDDRFGLF